MPLPYVARSGAKPFMTFREGQESSQEGGNTGRRAMRPCRLLKGDSRPFSSRPGSSGAGVIDGFAPMASGSARLGGPGELLVDHADAVGELDRDQRAFAQVLRGGGPGAAVLHPV